MFHHLRDLGTHQRPQDMTNWATPPELPLAWPLRRRRLPFDAGYIPRLLASSSKWFCTADRTGRIRPIFHSLWLIDRTVYD